MFLVFTLLILLGYPVAFTIAGTALAFGVYAFGLGFFDLLPLRVWGVMTNVTLLAVPLFVFMGVTLERSGLAEDLLETMGFVFGRIPGGIAIATVIVGTLLAASTGIVGATVTTMGLISLPTMIRRGYQKELVTGVICASGTLGQIIPPSIVLVIVGDILGVSVGDLFLGALIPGLVLSGLYLIYLLVFCFLHPELAPPIPAEERAAVSSRELARRVSRVLIPPLALMVCVLGSIFFGIASPTEAAAVGATSALILTVVNRKFTWPMLYQTMDVTVRLTSIVFIILVGATSFGLAFRGMGGDTLIRNFITHMQLSPWAVFSSVMGLVFILGFFLDFIEISFIHLPVLAPILTAMGFDPIWYGVVLGVNLQTSFLTPPFGYALFYLRAVAPPEVTTGHIYRGIIPFVGLQLIGMVIVILFPWTVTWLPRLVFG
ncbi:MAG: C4-dicarboxylate ABC transporter [Candidatus Rokubacteria bacterium RIFCSPLOWO2_02_FULL_68_19]|nr:MAG: C4-dicarboxylate ABC transporter [Candidatus Rokubacteria bacterium RIFCSPLOWO2_02_FULL_68_19]OGL20360.1 MAG: C4-dicarboxylate ABC transporter [Candidatus Rokubacteria bacterium RIFCSPLOWO2_12_FULL_69_21]